MVWHKAKVWYGLVADGFDDPAGLQRVVEEEVVVRRVLVRYCLKKRKKYTLYFFLYFAMLRIPEPNFSIPDPRSRNRGPKIPDPGSASNSLSI